MGIENRDENSIITSLLVWLSSHSYNILGKLWILFMEEPKQPEQIMQDITQCIKKLDIDSLDPRVQIEVRSWISTIITSAIKVLDGSDYRWCGANIIAEDKEIKMIYRSFARPLYKLIDRARIDDTHNQAMIDFLVNIYYEIDLNNSIRENSFE